MFGVSLADTSANAWRHRPIRFRQQARGRRPASQRVVAGRFRRDAQAGVRHPSADRVRRPGHEGIHPCRRQLRRQRSRHRGQPLQHGRPWFRAGLRRQDWDEVALALREFVSNAIDRSIREKGDWSGVKIEVVDEAQVRAKAGSHQGLRAFERRGSGLLQRPGQVVPALQRTGVLEQGDPDEEEPQPGRPQSGSDLPAWRSCPGVREQRYRVLVRLQPRRPSD